MGRLRKEKAIRNPWFKATFKGIELQRTIGKSESYEGTSERGMKQRVRFPDRHNRSQQIQLAKAETFEMMSLEDTVSKRSILLKK